MNTILSKYSMSRLSMQLVTGIIKPLTVAVQNNRLYLWAEVPTFGNGANIQIIRFSDGTIKIDESLIYLSTVIHNERAWHFYYKYVA